MSAETKTFKTELTDLLNKYSMENDSNTPDYLTIELIVLADYLLDCLNAFNKCIKARMPPSIRVEEMALRLENNHHVWGSEEAILFLRSRLVRNKSCKKLGTETVELLEKIKDRIDYCGQSEYYELNDLKEAIVQFLANSGGE